MRLTPFPWWRKLRAVWRDSWLLFRQFRWPLLAFGIAIFGGGFLYTILARTAGQPVSNFFEGVYLILGLTFLQPTGAFPDIWYLEVFYFLMPIIGIGIFAQGVAEFGVLFFNRRARGKEWEVAVATTFNQHVILIGLGHLGFRVVRNLVQMDQDVVAIELSPTADLIASARALGVPVIEDDGTREAALESAGIRRARSILLCTQNDSLNLQMAVKARSMNPGIQVIVRIFDDDFAQALQDQFGFIALSATGMAAPAFASAAAGVDVTRPITIEGETLSLARLKIGNGSGLSGRMISEIENAYNLSVVLLRRDGNADLHPAADRRIADGDTLAVLGGPPQITALIQDNHSFS